MEKNDISAAELFDLNRALALLTRIPVRADDARGARAAWAWPVAGAVVAFLAVIVGWVLLALGVSAQLTAALVLACQVVLTGAMHEDGLADFADGIWGGHSAQERLAIMHDSRIGTYGVLALFLSLLMRWAAITALISGGWLFGGLVAAAALSRVAMVGVMHFLPPARVNGLSRRVGMPPRDTLVLAAIVASILALLCTGLAAVPAVLAGAGASWGLARLALARVGGQTGDVLGAAQQVSEIAVLIALLAIHG